MFSALYIKEIQLSLRSVRFVIALAVVLLGFAVSGIVGSASYHNQRTEYEQRKAEATRELLERLDGLNRVAFHMHAALLPPTPYPYIRDLSSTRLPEMVPVNVVRHEDMQKVLRSNPLLYVSEAFTWQFILAAIGGFIAILLSYDAVAGERRQGTLSLVFSNPISRWKLLTAKILALTTINAVLIVAGVLLSLLILSIAEVPVLNADALATAAAFVLLAILYIAFVTTLGVLVSCFTRVPSLSLTVLFFLWVAFALVLPSAARIAAGAARSIQTPDERSKEFESVVVGIVSEGDRTRPSVNGSIVVNYSRIPFTAIERHVADYTLRAHEAERRLQESYERSLFRQGEFGLGLARWSPVELFGEAAARLTDSDIDRWRRFIDAVENYRRALGEAVRNLDSGDPASPHVYFADLWTTIWISQQPVGDAALIPRFEMPQMSLGDRLTSALQPAALIVAWLLVTYLIALFVFLRIDLRQVQAS